MELYGGFQKREAGTTMEILESKLLLGTLEFFSVLREESGCLRIFQDMGYCEKY